jgi:hypothetical protein
MLRHPSDDARERPVRGAGERYPRRTIGSFSRREQEPTGTIVRPALCRGRCYEDVPPPELPVPPPDVPPIGGHEGGGV